MALFDPETTTLNELAERHPASLPILHGYGLDACCGGALSVSEAARRHGVDVAELVDTLQSTLSGSQPAPSSSEA